MRGKTKKKWVGAATHAIPGARVAPPKKPHLCLSCPHFHGKYIVAWRHWFNGINSPAQLSRNAIGTRASRMASCETR